MEGCDVAASSRADQSDHDRLRHDIFLTISHERAHLIEDRLTPWQPPLIEQPIEGVGLAEQQTLLDVTELDE